MITFVHGGAAGDAAFESWLRSKCSFVYRFDVLKKGDLAKFAAAVVESQLTIAKKCYITDSIESVRKANDPIVVHVSDHIAAADAKPFKALAEDAGLEFQLLEYGV